jgi:hypothetical protein
MKAYTRSTGTIPLTVNADTKVKILWTQKSGTNS